MVYFVLALGLFQQDSNDESPRTWLEPSAGWAVCISGTILHPDSDTHASSGRLNRSEEAWPNHVPDPDRPLDL